MNTLSIHLFGRLDLQCGNTVFSEQYNNAKSLELFCYLLLHRDRPHSREALAALLWNDASATLTRKYLRKALWHLQHTLKQQDVETPILIVETDWLHFNPAASIWLDVVAFEQTYLATQTIPGHALDAETADRLQTALNLYRGNLLEGWYQDWCLYERARLQDMYFMMLHKYIVYCDVCGDYETGIAYGLQLLRHDQANELAHRCLMRLHYLRGDRSAAIHQYQRCVATLARELDLKPTKRTVELFEKIRADAVDDRVDPCSEAIPIAAHDQTLTQNVLQWLRQLQTQLNQFQQQLQFDIQTIEQATKD